MFEPLSVVQILKVGLSGLVFLLAYFGFRLLAKEQKRENPRDSILSHVSRFMWICVVLAILVGGVEVVKIIMGTGSESDILRLENELSAKDSVIATLGARIEDLGEEKSELAAKQLTVRQKVDLGLYYTQPVGKEGVERRDSKRAREYLFDALKRHDKELDEPKRAEIVKGLVRIREKLEQEEDFEFLLDRIEECRYNIEKELDLAKVYWAFANSATQGIVKRRAKSLEHFLRAASEFERSISDTDREDIQTLIEILKDKDGYLEENGEQILEAMRDNRKSEIKRHLDEWMRF